MAHEIGEIRVNLAARVLVLCPIDSQLSKGKADGKADPPS